MSELRARKRVEMVVDGVAPVQEVQAKHSAAFRCNMYPSLPARTHVFELFVEHESSPRNVCDHFLQAEEDCWIDERETELCATRVHKHGGVESERL